MAVSEVVSVRGSDALGYLDSQCTQALAGLHPGDTALGMLLAPKGELVAVGRVRIVATDDVELEVPVGTAAACIARLERFAIRADVAFACPSPQWPAARGWLDTELERIELGIPSVRELAHDLVVHALEPSLRDACVSFTKGCYPGQELVARMQARGATPPYVLRRCTIDGDARVGDAVGDPSKDGVVTSVVHDLGAGTTVALCVVHRADAASPTVPVRTATGDTAARFA